jgi:hypothetical protein
VWLAANDRGHQRQSERARANKRRGCASDKPFSLCAEIVQQVNSNNTTQMD